jgi:16S rRNA processing protein RimM
MEEYFKIGKFVAVFGLQGELVLTHTPGKKNVLQQIQVLFVEDKKNAFLPYFIESVTLRTDEECLVKIEDIHTPEAAKKLVRREVWLNAADFKKFAAATTPASLLGFALYNNKTLVGEICEVVEMPHQLLCKIIYKGVEALIPVHDESLQKIDRRGRKVYVTLPEGLLDIYTG